MIVKADLQVHGEEGPPGRDASLHGLGAQLEDHLFDSLTEEGWRVARDVVATAPHRVSGLVTRGAERCAVEIKVAGQARVAVLEGLLAAAILRSRLAARELEAMPLAVVGAPVISRKVYDHLRSFAEVYGEGAAWGIIDARGQVALHGPGLDLQRGPRRPLPERLATRSFSLFSDRSQWMLKVLLSHRLPANLQLLDRHGVPIRSPVSSATELAHRAGVSVPSAARLVGALRTEGFSLPGPPLELARSSDLLTHWRAAMPRNPPEIRARWLFPDAPASHRLEAALQRVHGPSRSRCCLALFAACRARGFDLVSGVSDHVYVESPTPPVLEDMGLVVAEPGEAVDVFLRRPRFPESVLRGANRLAGAPATDVLQCWLDVGGHPARGREMAEYLFERVLRPFVLQES